MIRPANMGMPYKRIIEILAGAGRVYQEEQLVAEVRYNITVRQAVHVSTSLGGETHETLGLTGADGSLRVIEGDKWGLDGKEELTLQVEDGRRMQFLINRLDPVRNRFSIVRTGGWENPR